MEQQRLVVGVQAHTFLIVLAYVKGLHFVRAGGRISQSGPLQHCLVYQHFETSSWPNIRPTIFLTTDTSTVTYYDIFSFFALSNLLTLLGVFFLLT